MMKTSQEEVLAWIRDLFKAVNLKEEIPKNRATSDNTGVDLILKDPEGYFYFIEAIAFSVNKNGRGTGKNQSDLWKAYSQACSRIKRNGEKEYAVIALPVDYMKGWAQRTRQFNKSVWQDMGPTELQVWFVSSTEIVKLAWKDSHNYNHE